MTVTVVAEWASIIGLIVSILSILITIWVAREISNVRRAYIRRVRLPELVDRLSELNSELSDYLNNFSAARNSAQKCISQLAEAAKSISSKLEKKERAAISALISAISTLTNLAEIEEYSARNVYLKATAAHESLSNLSQDLIWQ